MTEQDSQTFKKKTLFKNLIIVLTAFLIALTLFTVVAIGNKIKEGKYIGQEIEARNTIIVSATSEIYTKPDLALVVFSVITEAKSVTKATSENTKNMNTIIDFIKNQGVESKDLKTTNFNISPRYEYEKSEIFPYPQGKRILVGYEVRQSLQVRIRDMKKVGVIIQGATTNGANQVDSLQFTVDNQDEFKKQVREQAIDEAKIKAKELASQLGVSLVRITNFSESGVTPYYYGLERAVGVSDSEGSLQIETGESKIEATVTITYEIN